MNKEIRIRCRKQSKRNTMQNARNAERKKGKRDTEKVRQRIENEKE